ncbi:MULTISPECIES: hypothetical protein [Vibrio]|uniref:Uncharacterized protein n=1 Tax=Vibrio spartinae TaxID=1918945 RepID=A0A1N6M5W8_9VIBR|nr:MULTISPECIES: hypothetical protein [Vibrio]WNJ96560.1 hypothetical protein RND59_05545 [Vibrio ruber]SIO94814.1 hypothetical protein VSP9026_02544 [Vibrio spartinae]
MTDFTRQDKQLIKHVMQFGGKSKEAAIEYLNHYCGNWQGTPLPKAKRIQSRATDTDDE